MAELRKRWPHHRNHIAKILRENGSLTFQEIKDDLDAKYKRPPTTNILAQMLREARFEKCGQVKKKVGNRHVHHGIYRLAVIE